MSKYAGEIVYRIKRGELEAAPQTIDNDFAGRLLLAFDLRQPWTCHQTYKLFDELHTDIFARPAVTADRIVVVADIHGCIKDSMGQIESQLLGNYRLTEYFVLYLVREALELDEEGKRFCKDPSPFLAEENGRSRLKLCAKQIIQDLIVDLNAEVKEREQAGNPFDYKRELKSPVAVRQLTRGIIPQYEKSMKRGRTSSFGEEWRESAEKNG